MAITDLAIPYPDFKMYEVIDSEQFDANNAQMVGKINEVVQLLGSVVGGELDNNIIGSAVQVNPVAPFISTNLQAILKELSDRLLSIADGASGADLVNSTPITGLEGQTVQSQLESLKTILDTVSASNSGLTTNLGTHQTSADHDGRYYTKTLVDGLLTTNKQSNHEGTWNGYTTSQVLSASGTGFGQVEVLTSDPVSPKVGQIWMISGGGV